MLTGLDDSNFDITIATWVVPALVEFSASWCKPCVALTRTVEEIAAENRHRLSVAIVDVESSPALAQRFEVLSVPTLVLLINGAVVWKTSGAKNKKQLLEAVSPHLAG